MTHYRRKCPPDIEARQLAGTTGEMMAVCDWAAANTESGIFDYADEPWPDSGITTDPNDGAIVITLHGGSSARATLGDYICLSHRGQLFVRSAEALASGYEPVEES